MGTIRVLLPAGPSEDSYKIYLYIRIIDDSNGFTTFKINNPVQVFINKSTIETTIANLNGLTNCPFVNSLQTGNLQEVAQTGQSLAMTLNSMDFTDSDGNPLNESELNIATNKRANARAILTSFITETPISDIQSIKLISSVMGTIVDKTSENTDSVSVSSFKSLHIFINYISQTF